MLLKLQIKGQKDFNINAGCHDHMSDTINEYTTSIKLFFQYCVHHYI